MKRIVSIFIVLVFLINMTSAYTLKVTVDSIDLVVTREPGNVIRLNEKIAEIIGWNVKTGNVTITDNEFVMPEADVEIEAILEEELGQYLLTVENMFARTREEKTEGQSVTVEATSTEEYVFFSWLATGIELTEEQKTSSTITFTMPQNEVTIIAKYTPVVNEPVLGTGLTPVNWNGSTWEETDDANWNYNYMQASTWSNSVGSDAYGVEGDGSARWANAKTSDGSLYVWIPRYTYKITSGEHQSAVSWSSDLYDETTDIEGKIEVKFSKGTVDDTTGSYIAHPAFTFGTDELTGIWVAKYEASRNDATESSEGSGTTVSSKPGVIAWTNLTVSDMYDYAYNLNRDLDSHLMKNSEWGAVAYLTNAVGRIPYINNSNAYITGSSGVEEDSEESSTRYAEENGDSNTEFAWNTENGVRASSTHNIYGVYDLSGGAGEYMATYLEGGTNECMSSLIANTDTKYVDIYPANADLVGYTSSVTGDALYETSSEAYNGNTENGSIQASWDGDGSFAPAQSHPVLTRGGFSVTSPLFGVFFFAGSYGEAVLPLGFRPVLSIQ